jgi:hypothetical protein
VDETLRFLNTNMGALTVLFSAVVTVSTVAYALLTRKLVQETVLLRQAETEPAISVHITPSKRYLHINEMVIQNHGRGTAVDISWALSPAPDVLSKHGVKLESLELLKGLSQLAPGQQLRTFFGSSLDLLKDPICPDVKITAAYQSTVGKKFTSTFVLSPAQFRGIGRIGTPADDQIARSLENIATAVTRTIHGSRLHVATATERDIREEEERHFEERREQAKRRSDGPPGSSSG